MKKNFVTVLCSSIMAAAWLLPQVIQTHIVEAAVYKASTDTEANQLDFIENRDRNARDNLLTDEQKQLLDDAYKMRQELRNPVDPTKNIPIAIEGDDMFYDQATGDVVVNGNVQLTTLNERRLKTEELTGNMKDSTVEIDGKARMLQMTPDQMRIILTGYKTQYDYTRGLGKMEDAYGKAGNKFIKAKRVEFYPDMLVIYEGYATKCSAEHPDYRMEAERIEIYPDGRMISYSVKYYLGDILVYRSAKEIVDPNKDSMPHMPKAGYDSNNGFWISDDVSYDFAPNVKASVTGTYYTKRGLKANREILWAVKNLGAFKFYTGIFEDGKNNWLRKGPTIRYEYGNRIGKSPINWNLIYEHGIWHQDNDGQDTHASHTYYALGLSSDPVKLGTWRMTPSISYTITNDLGERKEKGSDTYESLDTSVKGIDFNLAFLKEYDNKWAQYVEWRYNKTNSKNSAFQFGSVDSYSRKLDFGVSYRMDNRNRFVLGYEWNMDERKLADVDCYWFYQMHCLELITRYRVKRHEFSLSMQFAPW